MSKKGTYEEELSCGGKLKVSAHSWKISYYFPGPDNRYNGDFVEIPGRQIEEYIEAYTENFAEYESLKASLPSGGEFTKQGKLGMSIRVGGFASGVCLFSYHMPISFKPKLEDLLDGYRHAAQRAPSIQEFLASL